MDTNMVICATEYIWSRACLNKIVVPADYERS